MWSIITSLLLLARIPSWTWEAIAFLSAHSQREEKHIEVWFSLTGRATLVPKRPTKRRAAWISIVCASADCVHCACSPGPNPYKVVPRWAAAVASHQAAQTVCGQCGRRSSCHFFLRRSHLCHYARSCLYKLLRGLCTRYWDVWAGGDFTKGGFWVRLKYSWY